MFYICVLFKDDVNALKYTFSITLSFLEIHNNAKYLLKEKKNYFIKTWNNVFNYQSSKS